MKLIASDYDGTLNYHGISERVREAIDRWRAAGNLFGIVTGRGIYNIKSAILHDKIAVDFFVANNGAVVANADGCPRDVVWGPACSKQICSFLLDSGCDFACVNDLEKDAFFCSDQQKETRHADDPHFSPLSAMPEALPFTQISTVCASESEAASISQAVNRRFADRLTAFQNGICIDIVAAGVDKAAGLCRLRSFYGIDADAICTVGDNNNDLAMLKAFRSYAVHNATDTVKSAVNTVVYDISELIEKEWTP